MFTLLIGMLLQPLTGLAAEKEVYYVGLGDSLAAGQTPYKELGKGYPDFIADKYEEAGVLKAFVRDYAVSGYTTQNVLDDITNDVTKGNNDSIKVALSHATHITLDAGANDLLQLLTIDRAKGTITFDQQEVVKAFGVIQANLSKTIAEIKAINPEAKIYLMGYFNPLPHLTDYQALLNLTLVQFNKVIEGVATATGSTYVATDKTIAANIEFLPNKEDVHLSEDGYKAIAELFWTVMKPEEQEEPTTPEPKPEPKPEPTKPTPVVYWEGAVLKKGQIGKLDIVKPINLWKKVDNKLVFVRVLNPGESYRIYNFESEFGGQYGVGGGHFVTKLSTHVTYKTPSKAKLKLVNG
jgi:lysophospholipase L1-like esterase